MRKLIVLIFAALASFSSQAEVWHARYGVAETFNFKLYNADGTLDVDEVDAGTEVSLSCNEGAQTTATNDFADEGDFYSIALTAAELQCERVAVVVAATTTEVFFIQTDSNASAMRPTFEANVASVTDGAIVAADLATDAITAAKIAADVSTEFSAAVFTVNATQISGDSGAADELELAFDGTAGAVESLGILRQGTAQSATATTLVLDSAASFADDVPNGMTLVACGSTQGYCQSRPVTDYVGSTDTATVTTWAVTPSGTITYLLFGTAAASGSVTIATGGIVAASFAAGAIDAAAIAADAIGASEIATDAIGAAELAASAIGASEIADGGITSAEFGTGAITATVIASDAIGAAELANASIDAATFAAAAIDASAIATDAIGAAELAADAIGASEIAADAIASSELAATAATEVGTAVVSAQGTITGTCDSGSTTTCVDNALTQADATQLEDRLICFDDSWCALITTFTPGTDTATTTKVAPSTRASKAYTIFPATLE